MNTNAHIPTIQTEILRLLINGKWTVYLLWYAYWVDNIIKLIKNLAHKWQLRSCTCTCTTLSIHVHKTCTSLLTSSSDFPSTSLQILSTSSLPYSAHAFTNWLKSLLLQSENPYTKHTHRVHIHVLHMYVLVAIGKLHVQCIYPVLKNYGLYYAHAKN